MDSMITAAALALASGDLLGALNCVALRDDAPALALRGIVMARLGDFDRARDLLRRAARGFGPREVVARARCAVAEAEIALVSRDLSRSPQILARARAVLDAHGDRLNAAHARTVEARRLLLMGRLDEAEKLLGASDPTLLPPILRAAHEMAVAAIAIRRLRTGPARAALWQARRAANEADIPALTAEVQHAAQILDRPAARLIERDQQQLLLLHEVEALFASGALVVDACRNVVRDDTSTASLATRPVLFALVRALGEAWPRDVPRDRLVKLAFGGKEADELHRVRLRVEIARLRVELGSLAGIRATKRGFVLAPQGHCRVVTLAPPVDERHAQIMALLADGAAWSSSALAMVLGISARTVQRAFEDLAATGRAQSYGKGRARRWIAASLPSFPSTLLLPGPPPGA